MATPQFTPQQRAFLVSEYHCMQRVAEVLRRFHQAYPNVCQPSRGAVYKNVRKYQATGTSRKLKSERSGRPRSGRSPANIQAVDDLLQEERAVGQRVTCRRNGLGIPSATFNRITRLDLRFHPYQMIHRHKLQAGDFQRRVDFCQWLTNHAPRFLENFIIGEEAGFAVNTSVSTHNVRDMRREGKHHNPPHRHQRTAAENHGRARYS